MDGLEQFRVFFPTCLLDFITIVLPPPSFLLPPCFLPRQSSSPIFFANLLRRSCLASSGSQCAPLDLNRKDPIAMCIPGPQPQGSDRNVHPWTSTACTPGPQPQGYPRNVHTWTSTARIRSQCASLDLNRKDPIAVCTPGPQPQGSDRSVHPWTSTARIRSQCAPLDLNRKDPIAMCTAGSQPDSLRDRMLQEDMPDNMPNNVSDRLLDTLPDRMSENMPGRMPEDMPDKMIDNMLDKMPEDMPNRMPGGDQSK